MGGNVTKSAVYLIRYEIFCNNMKNIHVFLDGPFSVTPGDTILFVLY